MENKELTQEEINELFDKAHEEKSKGKKQGQSMVEYALIIAFVSLVCFTALRGVGLQVRAMFSHINSSLSQVSQQQIVTNPPVNPPQPPTPPPPPPCKKYNKHGKCTKY